MQIGLRLRVAFATGVLITIGVTAAALALSVDSNAGLSRMEREANSARFAEAASSLSLQYAEQGDWQGATGLVQSLAEQRDWRIVVADAAGTTVADFSGLPSEDAAPGTPTHTAPIANAQGEVVGHVEAYMVPPPGAWAGLGRGGVVNWLMMFLFLPLSMGTMGGVLAYAFADRTLAQLAAVSAVVARISKGDLGQRVRLEGDQEIVGLGQAVNEVARKLEHVDQQRRSLLAEITHELRRPLTNVQGYAEIVQDQVTSFASNIQESAEAMFHQVQSLSRQVDGLRILAAADSDELVLNRRHEKVADLLKVATEGYERRALEAGVVLTIDASARLPEVPVDAERINQVIGNLLDNALAHMPQGGEIRISAGQTSQEVVISVTDTGEGIDPDVLPYVFERFFSGKRERSLRSGGFGLGLTIAQNIVELHGGAIRAHSERGQGATFTFSLPIDPKSRAMAADRPRQDLRLGQPPQLEVPLPDRLPEISRPIPQRGSIARSGEGA